MFFCTILLLITVIVKNALSNIKFKERGVVKNMKIVNFEPGEPEQPPERKLNIYKTLRRRLERILNLSRHISRTSRTE